jgi:hypothetical protein
MFILIISSVTFYIFVGVLVVFCIDFYDQAGFFDLKHETIYGEGIIALAVIFWPLIVIYNIFVWAGWLIINLVKYLRWILWRK